MALWQLKVGGTPRLARGPAETGPGELLPAGLTVDELLSGPPGALGRALSGPAEGAVPADAALLAPVGGQEIWAAGVTYLRSRDARKEESEAPDHYDRVYDADRPELFVKAAPGRSRGHGQPVGVRADSTWDVPEPELGVVVDRRGEVVAYTIGNDVSSRSIEGENPLYLPQAKTYTGSCALGPCLVPVADAPPFEQLEISLTIERDGGRLYHDSVAVAQMRRRPDDLVRWLFRAMEFPLGVVLLTGTAIVPEPEFTLRPGDEVRIAITGLGELRNTVELVGHGSGGS